MLNPMFTLMKCLAALVHDPCNRKDAGYVLCIRFVEYYAGSDLVFVSRSNRYFSWRSDRKRGQH